MRTEELKVGERYYIDPDKVSLGYSKGGRVVTLTAIPVNGNCVCVNAADPDNRSREIWVERGWLVPMAQTFEKGKRYRFVDTGTTSKSWSRFCDGVEFVFDGCEKVVGKDGDEYLMTPGWCIEVDNNGETVTDYIDNSHESSDEDNPEHLKAEVARLESELSDATGALHDVSKTLDVRDSELTCERQRNDNLTTELRKLKADRVRGVWPGEVMYDKVTGKGPYIVIDVPEDERQQGSNASLKLGRIAVYDGTRHSDDSQSYKLVWPHTLERKPQPLPLKVRAQEWATVVLAAGVGAALAVSSAYLTAELVGLWF